MDQREHSLANKLDLVATVRRQEGRIGIIFIKFSHRVVTPSNTSTVPYPIPLPLPQALATHPHLAKGEGIAEQLTLASEVEVRKLHSRARLACWLLRCFLLSLRRCTSRDSSLPRSPFFGCNSVLSGTLAQLFCLQKHGCSSHGVDYPAPGFFTVFASRCVVVAASIARFGMVAEVSAVHCVVRSFVYDAGVSRVFCIFLLRGAVTAALQRRMWCSCCRVASALPHTGDSWSMERLAVVASSETLYICSLAYGVRPYPLRFRLVPVS